MVDVGLLCSRSPSKSWLRQLVGSYEESSWGEVEACPHGFSLQIQNLG